MPSFASHSLVAAIIALAVVSAAADTVILGPDDTWRPYAEAMPPELAAIREILDEGRPRRALSEIDDWIDAHPDSPYLDQALFLNGQALTARRRLFQAFEVYEELLNTYSATALFEDVLRAEVEIARRFLAGEKRLVWRMFWVSAHTEGIAILDGVAERWPGSELAAEALMMQGRYYTGRNRHLEAQQVYQLIVERYAQSQNFPEAMRLSAEATLAQYQAWDYDTTCLEDAYIRFVQYQATFPQRAATENIDDRLAEIINYQIEKEFEIADFYRRTGKSSAARYYWQAIDARWPETDWAARSRELLARYDVQ